MNGEDEVGKFVRFVLVMFLTGGWWYLARLLPASLKEHRDIARLVKEDKPVPALGVNPEVMNLRVLIPVLLFLALFIYFAMYRPSWMFWLFGPPGPRE